MNLEFINYDDVPSAESQDGLRKKQLGQNILQTMECNRINFEVFERYTKILFSYCPMKGKSYDALVSEFISAKNSNDLEILANFNAFAQDECKVLYEKFFEEPFHPDL